MDLQTRFQESMKHRKVWITADGCLSLPKYVIRQNAGEYK